jgi:hypothetical protein
VRAELVRRGIVFAMARVKQDLRTSLDAYGLTFYSSPYCAFPTPFQGPEKAFVLALPRPVFGCY